MLSSTRRRGYHRKQQRMLSANRKPLGTEVLEDRRLLAIVGVNATQDVVDFGGAQQITDLPGPDNVITLREAIIATNNTTGLDEIDLLVPANSTFALISGELGVTDHLRINAYYNNPVVIDAGGASRVFSVDDGNGVADKTIVLSTMTITGGSAATAGGIYTRESLTVSDAIVTGNSSTGTGAGVSNNRGSLYVVGSTVSGNSSGGDGGGVHSVYGTLFITDSTITGNIAVQDGAGIDNDGANMTVTGTTISNNSAGTVGGGVYTSNQFGVAVTISNSTISANSANVRGGGVGIVGTASTATIVDSTINGNLAAMGGGGVSNRGDEVEIRRTTIHHNTSQSFGGGVDSLTGDVEFSWTTVVNSTISNNSSVFAGGGIANLGGRTEVYNSTVTENDSLNNVGTGLYVGGAQTIVRSSIISGNSSTDISGVGFISSQGYNVVGSAPGGVFNGINDITGIADPYLGPLQQNGGPTPTHAIISGFSYGEDNGANPAGLVSDQRGFPRDDGFGVDSGAFEWHFDDHGNAANNATLTFSDTSTFGDINHDNDSDWFTFFAEAGTTVTLSTQLATLPDSTLTLMDSDGTTELAFNDDHPTSGGLESLIEFTFSNTGQYYAVVAGFSSVDLGLYTLDLTHIDDHGDNSISSTSVGVGLTVPGTIEVNGDGDWFSFSAVSGQGYSIETTLDTLTDSFLELYDTDGLTLLESDDDGGVDLASRIVWTAPSSGTYYVNVESLGDTSVFDVGTYDLAITEFTPLPDLWAHNFDADSVGDDMVDSGETIDVFIDYDNIGAASVLGATYDVGLYLSNDGAIDPGIDTLVHVETGTDLAAGTFFTDTISITLPGGGDPVWSSGSGTYFLGMYVDDQFNVVESDETNNWISEALTVTVNQAPSLTMPADLTTSIFNSVSLFPTVFDPDNGPQPLSFLWTVLSGPGTGTFSNPASEVTDFSADTPGTYQLQLTVDDGDLFEIGTVDITFLPNQAPLANAGPDAATDVGIGVALNGTGSSDPDGGPFPLTYFWEIVSGGSGSFDDATSATPIFTPDSGGTYELRLTVGDGDLVDDDLVMIAVSVPNVAPVADAGVDQTDSIFNSVTLDGSGSFDPDGGPDPLSYLWTVISAPLGGTGSFDDPLFVMTGFGADVPGDYVIELLVSDGNLQGADQMTVTFDPNQAPIADAGPDDSTDVNVGVQLDGTGSSDPDGGPLPITYLWEVVSGPGSGMTTISDVNSAAPTFTADTAGTYELQLTVDDGGAMDVDTVLLTVNAPLCSVAGDLDCSGQVGASDLDLVLANWGVDTNVSGVPAGWVHDLPDGLIGANELDNVLGNWGNTALTAQAGMVVRPQVHSQITLLHQQEPDEATGYLDQLFAEDEYERPREQL